MKIFKIKKGKEKKLVAWCHLLSTELHNKAVESLKEENCVEEVACVFEFDGISYVAANMTFNDTPKESTDRKINIQHRKILKECIEGIVPSRTLYHITTFLY